mgnify:FL=1|jgi:bifunctional DNase/RNase
MSDDHAGDLVEMVVESVRVEKLTNRHVVILKERSRDRYLFIWIGPWEASAIAMRLRGVSPERPLTHDTFAAVLEAGEVRLRRVVITDLADETFHARLVLEANGQETQLDSRPSDALALAVRVDARIYADAAVLDRAGVSADGEADDGEPRSAASLERTGEPVSDERLEIFRDFVNSLELDPGDERRGGTEPQGGPGAG